MDSLAPEATPIPPSPGGPSYSGNADPGRSRRLRILHLEDDPLDAELVQEMLRLDHVDCDIKVVSTSEDFDREMEKGDVDIVISDYNLPGYCGTEALESTRKSGSSVPFIFVSGSIGEERAVEVVRMGATDYVMKEHLRRLGIAVRRAMEIRESTLRQREAEARLEQERNFLADVFSSVQDSIIVLDTNMKVVSANPTGARLFPAQAPLIGRSCQIFGSDQGRGSVCALAASTVRDNKPMQGSCTLHTALGDRDFSIYAYPLLERRSGQQTGAILYLRDVTRERALQAQLIQAQKMECLGQLAGGVAHDFNNVLQAIMGFSDMLAADLPDTDPRHEDAVEIRKASDRATALTRQLLAFSRKQVLKFEDLDMNAIVGNMSKMLQRLMGERVKIQYDLSPAPAFIHGDPGQIEQVVLNLVVNARDAMPNGGTITVGTRPCEITADMVAEHGTPWRTGRFVCLSVQDAGAGIPPEVIPRIFEPFFTTKAPGQGTGLGLPTVYGIVQQHEGWIDLDSKVGQGTRFAIHLPELPSEALVAGTAGPDAMNADRAPGNILIVEDDPMVRHLAQRTLELGGHHVHAVGSCAEGREYFKAQGKSLSMLISDVVLKDSNGIDMALEFVRTLPEFPVLMMSGYLDDQVRWHEIQDHGFAFLPKPFGTQELTAKVNEMLAVADSKKQPRSDSSLAL